MTLLRQEVVNVILAQLLQERGIVSVPEQILHTAGKRKMPDVIVDYNGLRTAIECEYGTQSTAHQKAFDSAARRVEDGIAHIGVAVVYPHQLRAVSFNDIKSELANSSLDITIITESGSIGYTRGKIDYLASALRRAFEKLVREDVVAEAVHQLDTGIEEFADSISERPGNVYRIAEALGILGLEEN